MAIIVYNVYNWIDMYTIEYMQIIIQLYYQYIVSIIIVSSIIGMVNL